MKSKSYTLSAYSSAEGYVPCFTERLSSYESAKLHAEALLHEDPNVVRVIVQQEVSTLFGRHRRKVYETRIPW